MEEKINVAEILKDKPQGTKLYNLLYNIDVELDTIVTTGTKTIVWCTDKIDNNDACHRFYSKFGTIEGHPDGLQILLPSKEMRDWRKFFKKGDVLVSKDRNVHIIFEKFEDDAYTKFRGKHYLWEEGDSMVSFEENEYYMQTSDFNKANKEDAQEYIYKIEKILGGKLNRETLEIEKAQPEFKDWDFITIKLPRGRSLIGVFKAEDDKKYYLHANLDSRDIITISEDSYCKKSTCIARLSTEEEKMHFFDVLAKKGKTWDAEKKQIVDLKPKVELKPFDKVLVRDSQSDKWRVNLFGYIDKDEYYHCAFANWVYCIPYAGNEHLLGTTKDVEG